MRYGVRTKVSPDASAATPVRPAGSRNQAHDGRTATTRLHAPVKTVVGSRKVLDLCGCTRPPLGADQRVHEQEVVERPALVAGATSRAQAVNFMADSDGCILLGVPAQHQCTTAAAAQHSTAAC